MPEKQSDAHVVVGSMASPGGADHVGTQASTLVSVCTLTLERHPLLALLEECLVAQDYPHSKIEWIIVDDSAPKPEGLEFRRAEASGIRVKYIWEPSRLKLGAKRNVAHQHCEGDIIVYMDDDDYYPPSRITHAVQALNSSDCDVAGCGELPLMLLPERTVWMTHSPGPFHATANTLAFRRDYLRQHSFDPDSTEATEACFLDHYTAPMVQLQALKTVTCVGHSRNTVDKRRFIASSQGLGLSRIHAKRDQFAPTTYLDAYCRALAEIEDRYKHGYVTAAPEPTTHASVPTLGDEPDRVHKIAVISPYHQEDLAILRRCHESVKRQSVACTHFLIADGIGLAEVDHWDCRHIRLGSGHADNGNTPRSIGALCAMNEGFTCIAYLDVDNWFLPEHLASVLQLQRDTGCEVVFTGREVAFPDGELIPQLDEEDMSFGHTDTSTIVVFEPAFKSLAIWAQMPRELGPYCDRVAFNYLTSNFHCAWTENGTVVFETWYENHFRAAGKLTPANAKFLPARPRSQWQAVGQSFRQRSHTPLMPHSLRISPEKARINLVSIQGPLGCGAYELQRGLCMLMTFFGLPPNDFLWQWRQTFGMDCSERVEAGLILERMKQTLTREGKPSPCLNHALTRLEPAIASDRSFNVLEAYFRLIQVLAPERCRTFSHLFGDANVIDRSQSTSLAADFLFELLPMHRALLVIDAPISQISRMMALSAQQGSPSDCNTATLRDLCHQYLDALIMPLEAAPRNQVLIVERATYLADPAKSLKCIVSWLIDEIPTWPAGLVQKTDTGGCFNHIYEREISAFAHSLDQQILWASSDSATSQCMAEGDIEVRLSALDSLNTQPSPLRPTQRLALETLFKPLHQYLHGDITPAWIDTTDLVTAADTPLAAIAEDHSLIGKVERLEALLKSRLMPEHAHVWQASLQARESLSS